MPADADGVTDRQPLDSPEAGARVEGTDEKRSPVDFALWKKAKAGEPSWPSPWGEGRPGWHTECVVMALDLLGDDFDLHGGGQDLAFPHHENERAQASADGRRFARTWVHNGFVEVEGTKMSKSLGNVTNLVDLVEQYDGRAYRLLVLQSHYRSPIDVTDDSLRNAEGGLDRLDAFGHHLHAQAVRQADHGADDLVPFPFRPHAADDRTVEEADLRGEVKRANHAGHVTHGGVLAAPLGQRLGAEPAEIDDAPLPWPAAGGTRARLAEPVGCAKPMCRCAACRNGTAMLSVVMPFRRFVMSAVETVHGFSSLVPGAV